MFGSEKKYKLGQYDFVCEMLGISKDANCGQTLIEKVVEVNNKANSAQLLKAEICLLLTEIEYDERGVGQITKGAIARKLRELSAV